MNLSKKKALTIVIIVVLSLFILNELRFLIWGAYGIPEQQSSPNCGESRYKYDVSISSPSDFLGVINDFKSRNWTSDDKGHGIVQWVMGFNEQYSLNDIISRNSDSLLFSQKIYGVRIKNPECYNSLVLEISEDGYASLKGCCGK